MSSIPQSILTSNEEEHKEINELSTVESDQESNYKYPDYDKFAKTIEIPHTDNPECHYHIKKLDRLIFAEESRHSSDGGLGTAYYCGNWQKHDKRYPGTTLNEAERDLLYHVCKILEIINMPSRESAKICDKAISFFQQLEKGKILEDVVFDEKTKNNKH